VYLASDEILKNQSGRKALMLLTDGEDTSSKISLAEAISSCEHADTLAYSIRIADDENPPMRSFGGHGRRGGFERPDGKKFLKQISHTTGGAYFEVSKKKSVEQIYSEIEEELRNQYSLGYSSDRPAGDTGYRKIALTVNRKGLLVQSRDNATIDGMSLKIVTKRPPTAAELDDLRFAFRIAKHVKSNTIVYAKDRATVGIGAGQMSRVDASRIAARKAEDAAKELKLAAPLTKGSVVASDAFFPFPDGLLVAIEAGATAVIQPGGSVNDDKVIAAANDHNVAMVLTGTRHFRH